LFDPVLNGLLGWGKSNNDICQIIWQGPLGINGFCNWIEGLVIDGNIAEELLDGKLCRLIEVMKNMSDNTFLFYTQGYC
jgi:hypothetical protein